MVDTAQTSRRNARSSAGKLKDPRRSKKKLEMVLRKKNPSKMVVRFYPEEIYSKTRIRTPYCVVSWR